MVPPSSIVSATNSVLLAEFEKTSPGVPSSWRGLWRKKKTTVNLFLCNLLLSCVLAVSVHFNSLVIFNLRQTGIGDSLIADGDALRDSGRACSSLVAKENSLREIAHLILLLHPE